MIEIPILNSIDVGATEPANISLDRSQSDSHPESTLFRTAQVDLKIFDKTEPSEEQTVKPSEKEEKNQDDGEDDGIGGVGVTTMAVAGVAAAVGVAVAAGGGGGGEDSASPLLSAAPVGQANLTGAWTGTWTDSSGKNNGSISLNLTQTQGSNSVSGSTTITGTNCTLDGTVSGTISGDSFQANITGSGAASLTASLSLIPTPTSMNGMLEIASGACAVVSGPFSTSITGGITIKW